jgi:phosphoribosylaminoimidazole-succinocarboxamide synthase
MQFKPTVYSYTMNRYGVASQTDQSRVKFTAALFRKMAKLAPRNGIELQSAFLAEIPSPAGPLLAQRKVETSNLEVRIKRYHIGSPLHRYRYTENYPSTQTCGPLKRWSRLDEPVVCFDWRNPLRDEEGNRLADEPISDDYASVWMYNVAHAKELSRQVFLWMEEFFEAAGIRLVDMCLLIDRQGELIYGEVSPDAMRVRMDLGDPASSEAAAKDVWRSGGSADSLRKNYDTIYERIFC